MGTIRNQYLGLLIILSVFFCSLPLFAEEASEASRPNRLLEIEVHRGDTLSRFAERYLDDPSRWPELLEYNKIPSGDPNLILPGDKLMVPVEMVRDEIADLIYMRNNVRVRRQDAPAWVMAGLYERLFSEDGIRTGSESYAQLSYLTGGGVNIDENSMIFLRPEPARDNVVKLEVGELRARDVKVLTASAAIDPGKDSDYTARVDEEQTTTLSVYKGHVDFISSGELVTVSEGFMARAEFNKPPEKPIRLPDPPEIKPMDDAPVNFGEFNPVAIVGNIEIRGWTESERDPVENVHIQLARDEDFSRMVFDKVVNKDSPDEWKENLSDGTYWWRAAIVTASGVRGKFSEPVIHTVDTHPPDLKIISPQDGAEIRRRIISVTGQTKVGSTLYVNDSLVQVDSEGNFVTAVNVNDGENEVKISATDRHGRKSERILRFQGQPLREEQGDADSLLVGVALALSVLSIGLILLLVMQ